MRTDESSFISTLSMAQGEPFTLRKKVEVYPVFKSIGNEAGRGGGHL